MRIPEHLRFSLRGFSAKRMAYVLDLISVFLLPFHSHADYMGDAYIAAVAFALTLVALALGFLVPRSDTHRFDPFALGLIVFLVHYFLQKL